MHIVVVQCERAFNQNAFSRSILVQTGNACFFYFGDNRSMCHMCLLQMK